MIYPSDEHLKNNIKLEVKIMLKYIIKYWEESVKSNLDSICAGIIMINGGYYRPYDG